ncbi:putative lim homeobox protein [Ixodes scapularis]
MPQQLLFCEEQVSSLVSKADVCRTAPAKRMGKETQEMKAKQREEEREGYGGSSRCTCPAVIFPDHTHSSGKFAAIYERQRQADYRRVAGLNPEERLFRSQRFSQQSDSAARAELIHWSAGYFEIRGKGAEAERAMPVISSDPDDSSTQSLRPSPGSAASPPATAKLCAACGAPIADRFYLLAVERQWHTHCLRCCHCKQQLDSELTCFARDGNIYCKEDYYSSGGSSGYLDFVTAVDLVLETDSDEGRDCGPKEGVGQRKVVEGRRRSV